MEKWVLSGEKVLGGREKMLEESEIRTRIM